MPELMTIETQSGTPIKNRNLTLIPFSKALQLGMPGIPAKLVWNRPASILVIDQNGQEQILQIRDITRQILWLLMGASALMTFFVWIQSRLRKEQVND